MPSSGAQHRSFQAASGGLCSLGWDEPPWLEGRKLRPTALTPILGEDHGSFSENRSLGFLAGIFWWTVLVGLVRKRVLGSHYGIASFRTWG